MRKVTSNVIKFVPHLLIRRAMERNRISKDSREAGRPEIGIFWALPNNEVISHGTALENAQDYGGFKTAPDDHHGLWETLRRHSNDVPNVRDFEYEYWPRGRINYDVNNDQFVLYADPKILNNPAYLKKIMREFSLPPNKTVTKRDSHYQSPGNIGGGTGTPAQTINLQVTDDSGKKTRHSFTTMGEVRQFLAKNFHVDADEWPDIREELKAGEVVDLFGDRIQFMTKDRMTGSDHDE